MVRKSLNVGLAMNLVIVHLSFLKEKYRGNFKPRRDIECFNANEEDDSDEQAISASDDEIGFVEIKEESLEKVALVSHIEKKSNWIIDSGCSHHMTGDMNKFVDFKS